VPPPLADPAQERRLAHPPAPVDDEESRLRSVERALQDIGLGLAVNERQRLVSWKRIEIIIIRIVLAGGRTADPDVGVSKRRRATSRITRSA
jgi:hypothetical protein